VPDNQGEILSPFIFGIFIDDLVKLVKKASVVELCKSVHKVRRVSTATTSGAAHETHQSEENAIIDSSASCKLD